MCLKIILGAWRAITLWSTHSDCSRYVSCQGERTNRLKSSLSLRDIKSRAHQYYCFSRARSVWRESSRLHNLILKRSKKTRRRIIKDAMCFQVILFSPRASIISCLGTWIKCTSVASPRLSLPPPCPMLNCVCSSILVLCFAIASQNLLLSANLYLD